MTTLTAIPRAQRRERTRKVSHIWQSPVLDIAQDGSGNLWGEQIELEFAHNAKRKQYEATISRCLWQPSEHFTVTSYNLFDRVNYPRVVFATKQVGRYGDKSFADFEAQVLASLDDYSASVAIVGDLLGRTRNY